MVQACTDGNWSNGGAGGQRRRRRSGVIDVGIEENILAILDDAKDAQFSQDGRLAFLEAVRTTSVVADDGNRPTFKMFETIFQIFRTGESLELIMASYQLLIELEQNFPRVYPDAGAASESFSTSQPTLAVMKEAWSPFTLSSDSERRPSKDITGPFDPSSFHLLIQDLAGEVSDANVQSSETKSLKNMLLFQYLVTVLEDEFLARSSVYRENMQWTILRESTLNSILGSRRVNYKGFVKDCLSVVCGLHKILTEDTNGLTLQQVSTTKSSKDKHAMAIAIVEVEEGTCKSMQKLMIMIMELDALKMQADEKGFTTRADGVRTSLLEVILDEVTYDDELLSPFLQVLNHPEWKLAFVLQYFSKYSVKPSVRTRRSADSNKDAPFLGTLRSFENISSVRSIIKKIGVEALQILMAHGFQAHLALSIKHNQSEGIPASKVDSSFTEICEGMISAFKSLRKVDRNMEILPITREALFVTSTILSTKS